MKQMRRLPIEEQIRKDTAVVIKGPKALCAICGTELQQDKEGGDFSCPVCDMEDVK